MTRKPKPIRKHKMPARRQSGRTAKPGGKQAAATKPPDAADALIEASAQALALPLDPAWRAGIKFNVELILRIAALFDHFPLPDDTEPAPVFHA